MSKLKILLIDDDAIDRMIIKRSIDKYCDKIVEVDNIDTGIEKLNQEKFDCILLDYEMPKNNGIEIIQKYDFEELYNTPYIIVSGHDALTLEEKTKNYGVLSVLSKDFINSTFLQPIIDEIKQYKKILTVQEMV